MRIFLKWIILKPLKMIKIKIVVLQLVLLLFSNSLFSQSVTTTKRTVLKLGEGIYVIRHKDAPDGNPQGNTSVSISARRVIVVDACYLPSSAREDIELIKKLTPNPVDYLINTHWHADHQQGNAEYLRAFPHIAIIAHEQTSLEMRAFENKDLARYRQNLDSLQDKIKSGKGSDGKSLSATELADLKQTFLAQDSVAEEFVNYKP